MGATQRFSAGGDVAWRVDGVQLAQSTAFEYTAAGPGVHFVEARAGGARHQWEVQVRAPDGDGDGWRANADCDDANADVRPARTEIFENGIDDDCDAGTADVPPGGAPGRLLGWGSIASAPSGRAGPAPMY